MSRRPQAANPPPMPHEELLPEELDEPPVPPGVRPPTVTVATGDGELLPAGLAATAVTAWLPGLKPVST